jgi:hypothetical protein
MAERGWWPDPMKRNELRFHDGEIWTEHVANGGVAATDPLVRLTPPRSEQPPAPMAPVPAPSTSPVPPAPSPPGTAAPTSPVPLPLSPPGPAAPTSLAPPPASPPGSAPPATSPPTVPGPAPASTSDEMSPPPTTSEGFAPPAADATPAAPRSGGAEVGPPAQTTTAPVASPAGGPPSTPPTSTIPPTAAPEGNGVPDRPALWRRGWFLAVLLVVAGLVIAAVVVSSAADVDDGATPSAADVDDGDVDDGADDGGATGDAHGADAETEVADDVTGDDPAAATTPATVPSAGDPGGSVPASAPSTEAGAPSGGDTRTVVGETAVVDGSTVRINRITDDVGGEDDLLQPAEGHTLSAAELEACAGPDGFSVNPLEWLTFLDDGTSADPFLFGGELPTLRLAPGGCVRGSIEFEVPAGRTLASVVLIDVFREEQARWMREGAVEPDGRLVAANPPDARSVGETLTFGPDHTATVRSVDDDAAPLEEFNRPAEGRQYARLDVELCAGTEPLAIGPIYWVGITEDGWAGTSALLGDTLPNIELAAGECAAGLVELDVAAGQQVTTVLLLDQLLAETGRWTT